MRFTGRLVARPFVKRSLHTTVAVLIALSSGVGGTNLVLRDLEEDLGKPPQVEITKWSSCNRTLITYVTAVKPQTIRLATFVSSPLKETSLPPISGTVPWSIADPSKDAPGQTTNAPCERLDFSVRVPKGARIEFLGSYFSHPVCRADDENCEIDNLRVSQFSLGYRPKARLFAPAKVEQNKRLFKAEDDMFNQGPYDLFIAQGGTSTRWPEGMLFEISGPSLYRGAGKTGVETITNFGDPAVGYTPGMGGMAVALSGNRFRTEAWAADKQRQTIGDILTSMNATTGGFSDAFLWRDGRAQRSAAIRDIVGSILIGFSFTLLCEILLGWLRDYSTKDNEPAS